MSSQSKVHSRPALKEYAEEYYKKPWGQLTSREQGLALTRFYVSEIYNKTATYISADDIDESIIDGSGDLGLDFIYRDDNVALLLQAKYFREKSGPTLADILNFQSILERIADPKYPKRNSQLAERISELNFGNDAFLLRFLAMGRIAGQAKDQIGKPLRSPTVAPSLLDRTTVEYLDEDALTDELRNALSQTQGISGDSELVTAGPRGEKTPILQVHGSDHPSYVLVVPAMQIVELYKNKSARDSLFTLNIRNYIGNTTTNKKIVETARLQPQHFFHFNNGISCLARKVTVNERNDRLKAVDLQIINGAQTVKALVRAAEGHQLHPEPYVLVRITEIQHGYGGESQFATEITRFNNTQNVIKISDFRSNDAVQTDLVTRFDYSRFGKPIQYIPKRTDRRKTNAIPIRLEEFSKVIYSFLYDPIRFSGQTSYLFDDGPQGGYRLIFGDGEEVWSKMPSEAFRLRSAIWWLADEFNRKLVADRGLTTTPIERGFA